MISIDAVVDGLRQGGAEQVFNFPGFHSHEIAEGLGMQQISLNERVAYSQAYGACVAGQRSVVTFKNVGLNIASDAFLHSIIGGVNAGLVVVVTDDTFVVGSQEFQDSRHYFDVYGGFWYEPDSPQDAYDFSSTAFELSEKLDVPVVIRLTGEYFNNIASYNKSSLQRKTLRQKYLPQPEKYVVHPFYFKQQEQRLEAKQQQIKNYVELLVSVKNSSQNGVIVFGSATYTPVDDDIMHIKTLPLPDKQLKAFVKSHQKITVCEAGDDFVYEKVLATGFVGNIIASKQPRRGEITKFVKWDTYHEIFTVINKSLNGYMTTGEIAQFTVETTDTVQVALSLGTAVGTAMGMAMTGGRAYAIVGDTSFLHEGRGILQEASKRGVNLGVIVIDNAMSWCTGGQTAADSLNLAMLEIYSEVFDARDSFDASALAEMFKKLQQRDGVWALRLLMPEIRAVMRS